MHKVNIPLLQLGLNAPVPPATVAQTFPLFCPQLEFVAVIAAVKTAGSVKVKLIDEVQVPLEVIITVCDPAHKLFTNTPFCNPGNQEKVVAPVPPAKATFPVPSQDKLQLGFVVVKVVVTGAG